MALVRWPARVTADGARGTEIQYSGALRGAVFVWGGWGLYAAFEAIQARMSEYFQHSRREDSLTGAGKVPAATICIMRVRR